MTTAPRPPRKSVSYDTNPIASEPSREYETISDLFHRLNVALWGGKLPCAMLTLHRHKGAHGYFSPRRFKNKSAAENLIHEIALNPDTMDRSDREVASTLLHEMCHHWQECCGRPSRTGYHNTQWADEMERVGLMPISTTGTRTGQRVSHTIMEGGDFDRLWQGIEAEGVRFRWFSVPNAPPAKKQASKTKFTCAGCNANAWAKLQSNIVCGDCGIKMLAEEKGED